MRLHDFVNKASRDIVVDGYRMIMSDYLDDEKLLAFSNQLDENAIRAINNHYNSHKAYTLPEKHLQTFLAASSLVHSINGWDYISRSVSSLIHGNESTAIHLAYYAELRASMSFLSSHGIGIFNRKHLAMFSNGSFIKNPKVKKNKWNSSLGKTVYKEVQTTTHQFTWDILERWVDPRVEKDTSLLRLFTVSGNSFELWANNFHTSVSSIMSSNIISNWLKNWNFDIKTFREDREKRNDVSYRPKKFKNFSNTIDLREAITTLSSFWQIISPLLQDRFDLLDAYLLRKLLRELHKEIVRISSMPVNYDDCVRDAMTRLGISDDPLFDLLCFNPPYDDDHILFTKSEEKFGEGIPVIARAILMLRVSTGMVTVNLIDAGYSLGDINFYLEGIGIENGFWTPGQMPLNILDLWSDIDTDISDLSDWVKANNSDLKSILQNMALEVIHFSQFNRAGLWGLNI